MSDQWYYRIYGQDFGPVSLELVRSLVVSGTIAPDDEVRDAARSNWILACAASELRDSIKSPISALTVERRVVRDEWYCRGAVGDFGPLKLIDLIQLAAKGELGPDEEIKAMADDYWKQINSFQRLIELLPFPDGPRRQQTGSPLKSACPDARFAPWRNQDSDSSQPSLSREVDQDLISDVDEKPNVILFPHVQSRQTMSEAGGLLISNPVRDDSRSRDERQGRDRSASAQETSRSTDPAPTSTIDDSLRQDLPNTIRLWADQDSRVDVSDSEWTGWIGGKEFGPVDETELLTWAVTGRLAPTDFVRQGPDGEFVPAVTIPCLFTVRAAAVSPTHPVTSPASTKAVSGSNFDRTIKVNSNGKKNLPLKLIPSADKIGQPRPTSLFREMANDPTSIGVSALLAIALIVVGWVAIQ